MADCGELPLVYRNATYRPPLQRGLPEQSGCQHLQLNILRTEIRAHS